MCERDCVCVYLCLWERDWDWCMWERGRQWEHWLWVLFADFFLSKFFAVAASWVGLPPVIAPSYSEVNTFVPQCLFCANFKLISDPHPLRAIPPYHVCCPLPVMLSIQPSTYGPTDQFLELWWMCAYMCFNIKSACVPKYVCSRTVDRWSIKRLAWNSCQSLELLTQSADGAPL